MGVSRTLYYAALFWLFGVIGTAATYVQHQVLGGEWLWMLASGAMGMASGGYAEATRKTYDFLTGLIFLAFGLTGIFHMLHVDFTYHGAAALNGFFLVASRVVLSQSLTSALTHVLLGLISCSLAMKRSATTPLVTLITKQDHEGNKY